MTRIGRTLPHCLWVAALLGAACALPESIPPTPNVLLIVVDALRADHLGCYGDERPISPTIDSLAAAGVLYENSYSYGDFTPFSHAALFASRYVRSGNLTEHSGPVLAELFSAAGYRTYGLSANPNLLPELGFARGFDSFTAAPIHTEIADDPAIAGDWNRKIEARSALETTDAVIATLEQHRVTAPEAPWFLFVNYLDPHDPYTERLPWSEEFRRSASRISGDLRGEGLTLFAWNARVAPTLSEDDRQRLAELYAAEIRYTDEHLRRLLEFLDEAGWRQRTLVALTSDHGELLGEHGLFTHAQACHEAELRVPLVFSAPWFAPAGRRVGDLAEGVDVAPTLLGLAGIPVPDELVGRRLLELRGEPIATRRRFTRHFHRATAADHRRELGLPLEQTYDSHVFRFDGKKLYLFEGREPVLYDISAYPERTAIQDWPKMPQLVAWARGQVGNEVRPPPDAEFDPRVEEALRSLGYIE